MDYSKTPQKHMTNQKTIKVIGKFKLIGLQIIRFIRFDFGRNNLNSMKLLLIAPLLVSN